MIKMHYLGRVLSVSSIELTFCIVIQEIDLFYFVFFPPPHFFSLFHSFFLPFMQLFSPSSLVLSLSVFYTLDFH